MTTAAEPETAAVSSTDRQQLPPEKGGGGGEGGGEGDGGTTGLWITKLGVLQFRVLFLHLNVGRVQFPGPAFPHGVRVWGDRVEDPESGV